MENESGLVPMEFNILVLPDPVEEKTAGGLILSEETIDRNKHQATRGTLIAASPMAFNDDVYPSDQPKPQAGQRVAVALHAGAFIKGMDGKEYRLVKDKDVVALIEEE